jgi:hypothetical protein
MSNLAPTVVIGDCDSGAPNVYGSSGCTTGDYVSMCGKSTIGYQAFVDCVSELAESRERTGRITGPQAEGLRSCAIEIREFFRTRPHLLREALSKS